MKPIWVAPLSLLLGALCTGVWLAWPASSLHTVLQVKGAEVQNEISQLGNYKLPQAHTLQRYSLRTPTLDPNYLPPLLEAEIALIYDPDTQEVIWAMSEGKVTSLASQKVWPMASITKLYTALLWMKQERNMDEIISVPDVKEINGKGVQFIFPGDRISRRDALAATLVASDNMASAALAKDGKISFIYNESFPTMRVVEPSGLSPENVASAADIARMAAAAWQIPELKKLSQLSQVDIFPNGKRITLLNTNPLLAGLPNWQASKTGFIAESGGNVVAMHQFKGGKTAILLILGSPNSSSRFRDLVTLQKWAEKWIIW